MALTITIEGKGVIANADASPDTAMAGSLWNEDGGGTDSFTSSTFLYGSNSFAGLYSNKSGYQYYDIGAANVLDFTANTGSEKDQFIFIWVMVRILGVIETIANKGLSIRIGTSLTDYREYIIAGSDDTNGWGGEWKCFVIDPNKPGSINDAGTFNVASVRYFGVYINNTVLEAGDCIFIDQISVGKGLRITGTSTTGWKDVVDYCTDYPNRAWGMFTEKEGIYFVQGKIYIGNTTQTANVSFKDSGRIIQWAKSEYYYSGGWVTSYPIGACGIEIQDAASYTTEFEDGILVGTDKGRAGSQFTGNSILNVLLDLYGGNNAGSTTKLYGTGFKDLTGTLTWGNDSDHLFYSGIINRCNQFNPIGAPVLRNCTFAETNDTDAGLLWNENIDIKDCNFIANTLGAAIEMPSAAGTPYNYDNLQFSGNTYDVYNSSGSALTVGKTNTSNPNTSEGSSVTFTQSISLTMVVKNESAQAIVGAYAYIDDNNESPYILNTTTNGDGVAATGYTGSTISGSTWRVRKYGYKYYKQLVDIESSNISIPITLILDPQQ
jgi:hypothetical protein